jgi:hypothetical protein
MLDEHVELLERVLVEQHSDALARRQLALGVLSGDAARSAALTRLLASAFEFVKDMFQERPNPFGATAAGRDRLIALAEAKLKRAARPIPLAGA